jgi:hypothetical protein
VKGRKGKCRVSMKSIRYIEKGKGLKRVKEKKKKRKKGK